MLFVGHEKLVLHVVKVGDRILNVQVLFFAISHDISHCCLESGGASRIIVAPDTFCLVVPASESEISSVRIGKASGDLVE